MLNYQRVTRMKEVGANCPQSEFLRWGHFYAETDGLWRSDMVHRNH